MMTVIVPKRVMAAGVLINGLIIDSVGESDTMLTREFVRVIGVGSMGMAAISSSTTVLGLICKASEMAVVVVGAREDLRERAVVKLDEELPLEELDPPHVP
jgi:hypothetical protein